MKNTKIEWATHTFNPWIGCTKVSPGCANCYAETLNNRMKWTEWGPSGKRFRTGIENLNEPRRWERIAAKAHLAWAEKAGMDGNDTPEPERPRVFCASLADWLDEAVPMGWRRDLLKLIEETPHLDWLLLTKRPETWFARMRECSAGGSQLAANWLAGAFPQNVWFGVSAENQKYYDHRMTFAVTIPARIHFVSAEPLLDRIVMGNFLPDWVIVGGESGPGARPLAAEWVTALRDECKLFGVAFFFKQWGGVDKKAAGRTLEGQTFSQLPAGGVSA